MTRKKTGLCAGILVMLMVLLHACEMPSKPDFLTEQRHTIPLLNSLSYSFLGGSNAIIDTTSADFENLFRVAADGLVTLGVSTDFDIGSLDDSIPDIDIASLTIDTDITEIEPFLSGSAVTDFGSFTGLDPSLFAPGTPIPAGIISSFDLELDMEDLIELITLEGEVEATLENQLGFTIDELVFRFRTQSGFVGSTAAIHNFAHGETRSVKISFTQGEVIDIPFFAVLSASWSDQNMVAEPDELFVRNVENDNFRVESATARFVSQTVSTQMVSQVSEDDFIFETEDDFVDVEKILVSFEALRNEIDLDFESLVVSVPNMLFRGPDGNFSPQDSVVIIFEPSQLPRRASHPSNIDGISFDIMLEDVRVSAPGNTVVSNVVAKTENTVEGTPGDRIRTVTSEDRFTGTVNFDVQEIGQVRGIVAPRVVNLNDAPDYLLDLADPEIRIETNIDDLRQFSRRIENLNIDNPELVLNYSTNVAASNVVYAAILGVSESGEQRFLSGLPGSPFFVAPDDTLSGLLFNGVPVPHDQLIKIPIAPQQGRTGDEQVFFTTENSTVSSFLSILPTDIFFIGKALINPDGERVVVERPISLDSELSLTIPISLSTEYGEPARISDTFDLDLSDLPQEGADLELTSGSLLIQYDNAFPVAFDFEFSFLDALGEVITQVPADGQPPVRIQGAPVSGGGFSVGTENNILEVSLTESQLRNLWQTERVQLRGGLLTTDTQTVSLRATDQITFNMRGTFVLTIKVGGE